ncbi:hypothetical protein ACYOEI_00195 [Singulisphaera rosea]
MSATSNTITIVDSSSSTTTGQGGQSIITGNPTTGSFVIFPLFAIPSPTPNSYLMTISGTWTGTLQFETSQDGTYWVSSDTMIVGIDSVVTQITANGVFKGNAAAVSYIRVRAVAAMTGAANIEFALAGGSDVQHSSLLSNPDNPLAVVISVGNPVLATGQAIIAVTGTAVQLPSHALINGVIVTAHGTNAASITIGGSSVTNTLTGSGNGVELAAGASVSAAVSNTNQLWVNGTAGDWISFIGS